MGGVLVIGASGQLATSLAEVAAARGRPDIAFLGRPGLDLTQVEGIAPAIRARAPRLLINAAAYTAVDRAEEDEGTAHRVNCEAVGEMARAAADLGAPFIHVSTDYVFDGSKDAPYAEDDATNPRGAYGRSKLAGEQAALAANPATLVFRTAWVYSPFGQNFVKTMLRLAAARDRLGVVDDQHGCPTYAPDLAEALLTIADRLDAESAPASLAGIYHLAGSGETTWCGFAREIMALAGPRGFRAVPVDAITTAEFPTKAVRPANSRLDCAKAERTFGVRLPDWRDSLERCLDRIVAGGTVQ